MRVMAREHSNKQKNDARVEDTRGIELARNLAEPLGVARRDGDLRAVAQRRLGDLAAEARAHANDDDDLVLHLLSRFNLSVRLKYTRQCPGFHEEATGYGLPTTANASKLSVARSL